MGQSAQADVVAAVALRAFLLNDPPGIRRSHSPTLGIVLIRPLKDRPKAAAADGRNLGVMIVVTTQTILASAIEIVLIWNLSLIHI